MVVFVAARAGERIWQFYIVAAAPSTATTFNWLRRNFLFLCRLIFCVANVFMCLSTESFPNFLVWTVLMVDWWVAAISFHMTLHMTLPFSDCHFVATYKNTITNCLYKQCTNCLYWFVLVCTGSVYCWWETTLTWLTTSYKLQPASLFLDCAPVRTDFLCNGIIIFMTKIVTKIVMMWVR